MSAKRQPISKVDTAWLRMEQPTNLMMITGVIGLDHDINFSRLVDTIALRFLAFPRFRHKAVTTSRGCFWEFDEDFDILAHVRRAALPGKADKAELQEFVSELASTPLDQSKPLWQFHLIENYAEGPVLVSRIHHCYADGIALIQVMLSLTDPTSEPRASAASTKTWTSRRAAESNIFKRFLEPARDGIDAATHWGQKIVEEAMGLLKEPEQVGFYAHEAVEIAEELGTALTLSDDPPTRFRGRLGVRKRVAWTQPLPLHEVKAVGRALGCTVNDVLIASATGALHNYLVSCGEDPAGLEIRATVPVNLRPLEHAKDLGNHFGLVFLPLPIGEENPLHRLILVHEHMEELKQSRQAAVAFGLLAALGMGPQALQKPMLDMMSRKASTVLTNVPGPRSSLYLAGTKIQEMMFWVPQNGTIGMGISILSYNQQVFMGLITDRRLVPDPEAIISRFQVEFEKLLYLAMQLPDGEVIPDDAHTWLAAQLDPAVNSLEVAPQTMAEDEVQHDSELNDNPPVKKARRKKASKKSRSKKKAAKKAPRKKEAKKKAAKKSSRKRTAKKKAVKKVAAKKSRTQKKAAKKKATRKKAARKKSIKKKTPARKRKKTAAKKTGKKDKNKKVAKKTAGKTGSKKTAYRPAWKTRGKKTSKKVSRK